MSDPLSFAAQSPRFALPLLFAGQAQKEIFVNEALARLDALLHCTVEGTAGTPPASPTEGESWIVGSQATGAWEGRDGQIAAWQGAQWIFLVPGEGMTAFDRATGTRFVHSGGWLVAPSVTEPSGGSTVDAEARGAIAAIVAALSHYGLLSPD